jgi:hypothetical protein
MRNVNIFDVAIELDRWEILVLLLAQIQTQRHLHCVPHQPLPTKPLNTTKESFHP